MTYPTSTTLTTLALVLLTASAARCDGILLTLALVCGMAAGGCFLLEDSVNEL